MLKYVYLGHFEIPTNLNKISQPPLQSHKTKQASHIDADKVQITVVYCKIIIC